VLLTQNSLGKIRQRLVVKLARIFAVIPKQFGADLVEVSPLNPQNRISALGADDEQSWISEPMRLLLLAEARQE
jgi:hypothetical protein